VTAPCPRQVGLSPVNRVGLAPNRAGELRLCFAGSPETLELLSGLPDIERWREWDCIALPCTRENVLVLETVGRVEEATEDYVEMRKRLLEAPLGYSNRYPQPAEGAPFPFRHQVDAFAHAVHAFETGFDGFANYGQMGTGKSRWAIDLMRYLKGGINVVIVQNSTALQWGQNLARLWPEAQVSLLVGMSVNKRTKLVRQAEMLADKGIGPQVLVVNWEALSRLVDPLRKAQPFVLVADEASRIKDRNSQMAKAAFKLSDNSAYKIVLTGTPMGNDPGDLWSLYRFMAPHVFGKSYWKYMKTYFKLGGFTGNQFTGFNPLMIGEFIQKVYSCAYRITKSCIADMPEKLYDTIRIPMSPEQQRVYDQVKESLYVEWETEEGKKTLTVANVLAQATRLQQITAGLFPTDDPDGDPLQIESAKTVWLADYVKETLETGDAKIVIWTRFRYELEAICKALVNVGFGSEEFGFIDGSVKTQDREQLRERFNDRGSKLRVLIGQLQAMAYGMDIPAADILIYHSNTYSHLDRAQSEDRGHRLSRVRPYNIIDLVCSGSIDEMILTALAKKQDLSQLLLMRGVA
jgi:SNF2 family DNA or RNA helicase